MEFLSKPNKHLSKLASNSIKEKESEERLGGCYYLRLKEVWVGGVMYCNANVTALSAVCGRKFN